MAKPKPKPSKPAKPVEVNRDSGTGRFVPDEYARSHPKTTETERYRRGSK